MYEPLLNCIFQYFPAIMQWNRETTLKTFPLESLFLLERSVLKEKSHFYVFVDQSFLLIQVLPTTQLIPECCQGLCHYTAVDANKIALETNENSNTCYYQIHFSVITAE